MELFTKEGELACVIDVGGTKIDIALVKRAQGQVEIKEKERLNPFNYPTFSNFFCEIYKKYGEKTSLFSIGFPGPLVEGGVDVTNLPWKVVFKEVRKEFDGARFFFFNDVEGASYSVLDVPVVSLEGKNPEKGKIKGVLSLGTGLGASFLVPEKAYWKAFPSQFGHAFYGEKTWEGWLGKHALSLQEISPQEILERAGKGDRQAIDHIENFLEKMVLALKDFALTILPYGGIYLIGGGSRALAEWIKGYSYDAFYEHPTMEHLLKKIPLFLVEEKEAALKGLYRALLERMFEEKL